MRRVVGTISADSYDGKRIRYSRQKTSQVLEVLGTQMDLQPACHGGLLLVFVIMGRGAMQQVFPR